MTAITQANLTGLAEFSARIGTQRALMARLRKVAPLDKHDVEELARMEALSASLESMFAEVQKALGITVLVQEPSRSVVDATIKAEINKARAANAHLN